jgi:serine/threonine-protein kinase RsbT
MAIGSDADVVVARQHGRALAVAMKFSATDAAFIATAISELARALLAHTAQGEIRLQTIDDEGKSGVVILARDPVTRGRAAGGPPAELTAQIAVSNVFRLVDEFDVAFDATRGTTVRAARWRR